MRLNSLLLTSAVSALGLSAATAEPITVYAPWPADQIDWVAAQAAAAGHEAQFIAGAGGELFDRILAERNNPQADVALGFVDAAMATLKSEGLLLAYEPVWGPDLPEAFRDDADGMVWKFWQTPIVIAYNADTLATEAAPTSWLDLVQPEYQGRYVIGSINWQTTRAYLAGILARFTDENGEVTQEGWDFMTAFYANAIVVEDGDAKTQALASGDAVIDLNWFGGAFNQARDVGYSVTVVDTEGGTPFIADGLGIMAGTDQVEQSQAFVDWFGGAEFMAAYAHQFGRVPNLPQALANAPEQVQINAAMVSPQPLDWDAIAPRLDGWLQTIELEIR
ncbi:MAG: iron(III) transport system substrate-binding protein [Rhodobacteraceae bacterium HLUCCA08]|nr:MAG: iron(III) transport system substrate-binding protein [Rhodobacteraceae bacterium HLUCCA08]